MCAMARRVSREGEGEEKRASGITRGSFGGGNRWNGFGKGVRRGWLLARLTTRPWPSLGQFVPAVFASEPVTPEPTYRKGSIPTDVIHLGENWHVLLGLL